MEERPKVLMTLRGSIWMSNTWKQELVITEDGVEGEVISGMKTIKMSLPFDRIAQVNLVQGVFKTNFIVINKGGSGNLVVKALPTHEAQAAKELIEERMKATSRRAALGGSSVADELRKLATLKDDGLISEDEFAAQKAKLLV